MFKNNFLLTGFVKKISELNDSKTEKLIGYYLMIATIGESFGVFVPLTIPNCEKVKLEDFVEITGIIKTKIVISGEKNTSSIAKLSVVSIEVQTSPFAKK